MYNIGSEETFLTKIKNTEAIKKKTDVFGFTYKKSI